ncbi:hypothetical protein [Streptomyces sp. NPDC006668]|uniref:hypothetical protein n=1 Tax=Streptomyces sp. NPDC006668 TaxID=3156903 RepID=UPI0033D7E2F3
MVNVAAGGADRLVVAQYRMATTEQIHLITAQVDHLAAVTPQHPGGRHRQAVVIERGQLRHGVVATAPTDDRAAYAPARGPDDREDDDAEQ